MHRTRIASLAVSTMLVGILGMDCIPPELREQLDCPNPAATALSVEVLSRDNGTGTIRLTGTVRNIGLRTFDSSAGQQSAQVWEGSTVVATEPFTDLAPNESLTVTYETTWTRSSEFQADYTLRIAYDPDIFIDGNEQNDDCNTEDNERTLSATQINSEFDAAGS